MSNERGSRDPWPPVQRPRFAWIRDHWRVGWDCFAIACRRLWSSLLVWLLVGISLALPTALYILQRNLAAVASQWDGRPSFTVYLQTGTDVGVARVLATRLDAETEVERAWVITPEQALEDFGEGLAIADALEVLGENPLPASVRATVADGVGEAELQALVDGLRKAEQVDEVAMERAWLERMGAISALVGRVGWILAGIFGLGAALVTASSVRLVIESRLEELRVQKLVGGTNAFVRRPFLYFGLFYGVGGGVVAAMLVSGLLIALEAPLERLFSSYHERLAIHGMSAPLVGVLLGVGGLLGVCGALIASGRRLRGVELA
ncbi:MAG: permease-like cell division protein FtsX [Gammaproteobacteria bacterium]|nr:permease-like cell division protein FtsX [Gammaproteobacteria bacterium]